MWDTAERIMVAVTAGRGRWPASPGGPQVTQIVIGASTRIRWQQLIRGGSNVARIIWAVGEIGIDVHVTARNEADHTTAL